MAGTTYDALVRLMGDTTGFSSAMKKAQWDAAALGQKMQAIGGIMSNVGRTMTMYVTLPIVAGMALATKAAIDEEKEMALLAEAMRTNADATQESIDATEAWITAQQNATGISDGDLRPALAALVAATKDTAEAQDLLSVAMDISVAKGKPLQTVSEALAKAHLGNVGALGRLGVATKDAEGKTLSFDEVMKNAIATYGGAAAAAADTTAGKFAILKAKIMDLVESVGAILIPFVSKAVDLLARLADWAGNLPPVWQQIGVAMAAAAAAAGPILMVLGKLITIIGAIMGIAGGGWIAAIVVGIVAIATALGTLYAKSETFRDIVGTVWTYFMETVKEVWAVVQPLLEELWALIVEGYEWVRDNVDWAALWTDLEPVLSEVQAIVVNFVTVVVTAVTTVVSFIREHWSTIGPIIKAAWDTGMAVTQAFFRVVGPILGAIADILNGDFSAAWEHAKEAVRRMAEGIGLIMENLVKLIGRLAVAAAKALWEAIKDGVEAAVKWVASLPGKAETALATFASVLLTVGKAAMTGLWNGLKNAWGDAIGWLKDLPGKVKNVFASAGSWLVSAGGAVVSGLINGITSSLGRLWSLLSSIVSRIKSSITNALGINSPSTVFAEYGRNIMDGLMGGMASRQPDLGQYISRITAGVGSGSIAGGYVPVSVPAAGTTTVVHQHFNVTVQALEPDERIVGKLMAQMAPLQRRAAYELARKVPR